MPFEEYVYAGTQRLRRGYTTGTCAALAAQAATVAALSGTVPEDASLITPAGIRVRVEVTGEVLGEGHARCTVVKDAGDDYDVTDGARIVSDVELFEPEEAAALFGLSGDDALDAQLDAQPPGANLVLIDGGVGVGRVTKPGLDQAVGNAAINAGPRKMIAQAVRAVLALHDCACAARVIVSVPEGEALAGKTFNPHIGIEGGISILGTSGIVEPRSLEALKSSLTVEIRACAAAAADAEPPHRLVITPGNYGEGFLATTDIPDDVPTVKCANFIGHALDCAAIEGFDEVLLVGHIGKLAKVAGGIMDTHSRVADCRCEVFAAHAALCGATRDLIEEIMGQATTDACIDVLDAADPGLARATLDSLAAAIQARLERRVAGAYRIGAVVFSNKRGTLAVTPEARDLLDAWGGGCGVGDVGECADGNADEHGASGGKGAIR